MRGVVGRIVRGGRAAGPAFRWSICLVYAALVATASLLPSPAFPDVHVYLAHADKFAHVAMYGVFSVILYWAVMPKTGRGWPAAGVVLVCCLYGLAMEVLQANLPSLGRTFSTGDLIANFVGSGTAAWGCFWLAHASTRSADRQLP